MGFKRRMRTRGKVEIPEGAMKEAELLYLHDIVSIVKKRDIPSHLYELRSNIIKICPSNESYKNEFILSPNHRII